MQMSNDERNMVLRSVYLTAELDDQLRTAAFHLKRSKGDLIRQFISMGLEGFWQPSSANPGLTKMVVRDPSSATAGFREFFGQRADTSRPRSRSRSASSETD
jgi:hypothetical protein